MLNFYCNIAILEIIQLGAKKNGFRLDYKYYQQNMFIYLIYMYKQDLALNNLQWLLYQKPKPNQTKPIN